MCVRRSMNMCVQKHICVTKPHVYVWPSYVSFGQTYVSIRYMSLWVAWMNIQWHTCVTSSVYICVSKDTYVWHDFRNISVLACPSNECSLTHMCVIDVCICLHQSTHVCQAAHICVTSICCFWSNICIQHIHILTRLTEYSVTHMCDILWQAYAKCATIICLFCTYIRDKHMYFVRHICVS